LLTQALIGNKNKPSLPPLKVRLLALVVGEVVWVVEGLLQPLLLYLALRVERLLLQVLHQKVEQLQHQLQALKLLHYQPNNICQYLVTQ
jgi:hypothetical protein